MLLKAIAVEIILFSFFVLLIIDFTRDFPMKKRKILVFVSPLFTFLVGFSLRLTGIDKLVDLGFFFTELSTIFVTILFTLCLYLGQVKYWKLK